MRERRREAGKGGMQPRREGGMVGPLGEGRGGEVTTAAAVGGGGEEASAPAGVHLLSFPRQ